MTGFDKDFTHSSSWAKRRISNLSVRIEIPKQVRNDSCAQLSPRERVKLSLSRWRKDTISREGSSFFQSNPLPLSLSSRRGKNYHVILRKAKNLFPSNFLKINPLPLSLSIGEGRITSSSWAKRRISNLSVRIEIPKQVRNDSCAQLSPRERVKLSLSRWRKDTISREGSSFFQSDPLPQSLSIGEGRITSSHWAMQKISFPSNFGKNRPSPSGPLPSEREKLPRHSEQCKKSVLSTVLKNPTISLNPSPVGEGRTTSSDKANFLSSGNSLHNYFR